ncbi:MAG TPA: DsbA family protein [Acidimicrobiales bacterium]
MRLTVYADFNCPFSALANHRLTLLEQADPSFEVDLRAVEHAPRLPPDGKAMVGKRRDAMVDEVAEVLELATPADGDVDLPIPDALPNTAALCEAYATSPSPELRRQLFATVWGTAAATAPITAEGSARKAGWQREFETWDEQVVPSLVFADGTVVPGKDALHRLAEMLT